MVQILRPIRNLENNITVVIEKLGCKTLNSVQQAQDRVHSDLLCLICSHFVSSNKKKQKHKDYSTV